MEFESAGEYYLRASIQYASGSPVDAPRMMRGGVMHETPSMRDGEHTGRADSSGGGVRFASSSPQYSHNDHTRLFGPSAEVVLVRNLRVMVKNEGDHDKLEIVLSIEALIEEYERKTGKVD